MAAFGRDNSTPSLALVLVNLAVSDCYNCIKPNPQETDKQLTKVFSRRVSLVARSSELALLSPAKAAWIRRSP